MRALISGGAGQIGCHLSRALLERGHEVICVDNLLTGSRANIDDLEQQKGFEFWQRDVTETLTVTTPVDAVYHLASPASPADYMAMPLETMAVNSAGTWELLRLAHHHRARFLFASTSEVYGDPLVHPQREDYWGNVNPSGLRSCYDEGKRFGEALVQSWARQHGTDARIVRIFNTYGPYSRPDDGRLVPNFVCQALRGEPFTIYGSGRQTRSLCYIADTVEGLRLALECDAARDETVNIGSDEEHTVEDLAREVARASGVEYRAVYRDLPPDDPTRRCPDLGKAKRLLGWQPKWSLSDGLKSTAAWFRTALAAEPAAAADSSFTMSPEGTHSATA